MLGRLCQPSAHLERETAFEGFYFSWISPMKMQRVSSWFNIAFSRRWGASVYPQDTYDWSQTHPAPSSPAQEVCVRASQTLSRTGLSWGCREGAACDSAGLGGDSGSAFLFDKWHCCCWSRDHIFSRESRSYSNKFNHLKWFHRMILTINKSSNNHRICLAL